jgi:hypothetical protein
MRVPSSRRFDLSLSTPIALLAIWFLFSPVAHTQQAASQVLPSAPSAAPESALAPALTEEPPTSSRLSHRFWDRTNCMLFAGGGVFRGLDYASTRNMQARGREEILLPDDVVNNSAGFASLEAAGTVASVGLSYWMHRMGHHKLERWVSIVHISVTGFGVARNYALDSQHP